MKRWISLLMSAFMLLALAACAREVPPAADPQPLPPPVEEEPSPAFWFEKSTTADKFSDDEGRLLAAYSYQIMEMKVSETADEETVQMAESFNRGMQEVLDGYLENADELSQWAVFDEYLIENGGHYSEEVTVEGLQKGSIYTVCADYYNFMGGPHPSQAFNSYIFDVERGAFIDPLEIADDPEHFRAIVTDLLLDRIQHLDEEIRMGYFEGYEDTVAQWNTRCVAFGEEEMTVIFSAYDLAPYAGGAQVFELPYGELQDALGEGGQIKLGLLEAPAAEA